MNLYEKLYCKTVEKIQELIMANDDQIDEKFQYDINREAAKILSSRKTDKDDYLASEEILSPNQRKS